MTLLLCLLSAVSPQELRLERSDFEHVREEVARRYVDDRIDESWAWAMAASFVLAGGERPRTFLPEPFYRRFRPEGATSKLADDDAFLLLEAAHAPAVARTPQQVLADRQSRRDRHRALREAWSTVGFGQKDFERAVEFARRQRPDARTLWTEAVRGYLASLDPHCELVSKAAWETGAAADPAHKGVGVVFGWADERPIVEAVLPGGPAVESGLKPGDRLQAVDGTLLGSESLPAVMRRIRGPEGSRVRLTILREGEAQPRAFEVVRRDVVRAPVKGEWLPDLTGAANIRIGGMFMKTADELSAEIGRLSKEAALRGLILDVRGVSGGLLTTALKVADLFLKSGRILTVAGREAETYEAKTDGDVDLPLVVLIDSASAGAAEVVAAALQDHGRALIVGDRSFGKGAVQTLYTPEGRDDYYVKLTVARYQTPGGRLLQGAGVTPDVPVPAGPAFREENRSERWDPQNPDYRSANEALSVRARTHSEKSLRRHADEALRRAVDTLEFLLSE